MKKKKIHKSLVGLISILVATSCVSSTSSLQPEVVSRIDAQKQQYVVFGTIRDTNKVTIEAVSYTHLTLPTIYSV